ncbi:hypothetical protein RRF57_009807 [Xylaria bambusicola]|uniref:Uncharacterized protein n=1 Tax=Xylaria bambusicola TaxID=326684 RepID=A0AAN7UR76_9PEZI
MTLLSAEEVRGGHGRLTFQEALGLISLPDKATSSGDVIKRYMSRRSAWTPGLDFVPLVLELGGTYTAATFTAKLVWLLRYRSGLRGHRRIKVAKTRSLGSMYIVSPQICVGAAVGAIFAGEGGQSGQGGRRYTVSSLKPGAMVAHSFTTCQTWLLMLRSPISR